jgi:hypothetical protein
LRERHIRLIGGSALALSFSFTIACPGATKEDDRLVADEAVTKAIETLENQPDFSHIILPSINWKSVEDFADTLSPDLENETLASTSQFERSTGIRIVAVTSLDESALITIQRARRFLIDADPDRAILIVVVSKSGGRNALIASRPVFTRVERSILREIFLRASAESAKARSASERFRQVTTSFIDAFQSKLGVAVSRPKIESSAKPIAAATATSTQAVASPTPDVPISSSRAEVTRPRATAQLAKLSELAGGTAPPSEPAPAPPPAPKQSRSSNTKKVHTPDIWESAMYWICGILVICAAIGLAIRFVVHKRKSESDLASLRAIAQKSADRDRAPVTPLGRHSPPARLKPGDKGIKDAPISVKPRDGRPDSVRQGIDPAHPQLSRLIQSAHMLQVVSPRLRLRLINAMQKQIAKVEDEIQTRDAGDHE